MLDDGRDNEGIDPTRLCVLAHSEFFGYFVFLEAVWVEFSDQTRDWVEVNRGEYQVLCKMVDLAHEKGIK